MPLFTSNFKRETPVLGLVALALIACEIALRLFAAHVSLDLQHIRDIPRIVTALHDAPQPTLLFLGNSLTRRGVESEILTQDLTAQGFSHVTIAKIHPDDTDIADWLYVYERYVRSTGTTPDVLLVGFAENQLSDALNMKADLLEGSWAGLSALPSVFGSEVLDFNTHVDYLLSGLSFAFANRDRVRTQFFGEVIPYYKSSAQVLNNAVKGQMKVKTGENAQPFKRLTRFIELFKGTPTKVIFIAIPLPTSYPIDPAVESIVKENGSQLIDLRKLQGLTQDDFLDGYHLSPHGGAIFTRELSRQLLHSSEFRKALKK